MLYKVLNKKRTFTNTLGSFPILSSCDPQMIPLFLLLHVCLARLVTYDQLPLSSLADYAPHDENVGERHYLPEENMAENEERAELADIVTKERSCVESSSVKQCPGSKTKYVIVKCRKSSLTSCHRSIPYSGYRKCKAVYTHIPKCGVFSTSCKCA